jgi:Na+/H+ antiporter NhaD/arsenite permease-like protein
VVALGQVSYGGVTRDVAGLLRDLALLGLGLASVVMTPPEARDRNQFSWEPIREVASLFPGIFVAMLPVILMLKAGEHGALAWVHEALGGPGTYFCLTGVLSSFLDNTPTYLVFLSAALGTFSPHASESDALAVLLRDHSLYLQAISAGAVFMGANTYLGNAPNLLVRSVAQEAGVAMPGFFAYTLRYALPLLAPVFACVFWWFS